MTGAPGGIRTHDPWLRRPILYPLSYGRVCRRDFITRRIEYIPEIQCISYNERLFAIRHSSMAEEIHVERHSSAIKTPMQLVAVVVLAFVVPVTLISMLAHLATRSSD